MVGFIITGTHVGGDAAVDSLESRVRDADYRERCSVEPNGRADRLRPPAEAVLPEVVLKDRDGMRVLDLVVFRTQQPAKVGAGAKDVEEVARHEPDAHSFVAVLAYEARRLDDLAGQARKHGVLVAESQVQRMGEGVGAVARVGAEATPVDPQLYQRARVPNGKKPQEDLIDKSEHRGVRAYTERQRQNRHGREHRCLGQRSQGQTDFSHAPGTPGWA
jgi:hypothetical protein